MIWIFIIVIGIVIYFTVGKKEENKTVVIQNKPVKSPAIENSEKEKDNILQNIAKYSDTEMTPEEFENSIELYRILQPINVEGSNQELLLENFDNKVLNIVHNTYKHGIWRTNDKHVADKCFENIDYIKQQQSSMIKDFELNFEDSYSLGVSQEEAQDFIKKWILKFKNNALERFQKKAVASNIISTLDERMTLNSFVAILEGISNKRVHTLNYKNDQDAQAIVQSYFNSIFGIALGKIEDLTLRSAFFSDRDFLGKKIDGFTKLTSSILNDKNTFQRISQRIEEWISNAVSEMNPTVEAQLKSIDDVLCDSVVNDFNDLVNIAKAEQLYNQGVEFFKQANFNEANKCFEKAGDMNDRDALYQLGNSYLEGKGVTQDYIKAGEYYLKASELDHIKAQYNIGLLLLQGNLGARDLIEGRKWITKSALNGYSEAQKVLEHLNK